MTPRQRAGIFWGAWVAAFAVAETVTVRRDNETALCNFIRPALGTSGHPVHRAAGAVVLLGFAGWFAPHLYRQPKETAR